MVLAGNNGKRCRQSTILQKEFIIISYGINDRITQNGSFAIPPTCLVWGLANINLMRLLCQP